MKVSAANRVRIRECTLGLVALVLIGGALALTFSHVLQSSREDIAGRYDVYRYYGPITFYLDFCISQGDLPLWNPMVYCGLPNAANPQAFVFYPLNLLRSLMLQSVTPQASQESVIALVGLHLLLLGFGTYALGRAHRLSFPGALVAALAWVCSALIVRRACEYHFLYTMAWLPFVLILVKCAIDSRHGRVKVALCLFAGLLFGLGILGGFLQIVNYAGVTIGVYALLYRLTRSEVAVLSGWRARIGRIGAEGLAFASLLVVAGLTAAVLLLPTLELASFSTRGKGEEVKMYSDLMGWNITHLYQSLVVYPGMKWEPETIRTAGITALLLVAAGLFNRRRKLVAVFGLLAYALIDCSFGPPFPIATLVNLLTPFASSAYSRGFDFALLPFGLLAGLGVDTLIHMRGRRRGVLALVLIYVAGATLVPLWGWTHPHPFLKVTALVVAVPAAALLVMLLAVWLRCRRRIAYVVACMLPLLLVGETFAWNSVFVPWMIKRHLNAEPPRQTGHAFPSENRRGTDPIPNRSLYSMDPVMNGVDPLHLAGMRTFVSGQFRERLNKREIRDWEPTAENARGNLLLKRFFWLVPSWTEGPPPGKQALFPPTEVAYLESAPELDIPRWDGRGRNFQSVSDEAVRIDIPGTGGLLDQNAANQRHQLRFTVPKSLDGVTAGPAQVLHGALVYHYTGSIPAQVDTVFVDRETGRRQWGLRHRVKPSRRGEGVIEVPLPDMHEVAAEITIKGSGSGGFKITGAYLMVDLADNDGKLAMGAFSANRMVVTAGPLDEPRLLVFVDAWYPGWSAWIDGKRTPILRANGEFKAVALPAGTHEVVFEYRPGSVYLGAAVSGVTALVAVILAFWLLFRQQRITRAGGNGAGGPPLAPVYAGHGPTSQDRDDHEPRTEANERERDEGDRSGSSWGD